MSWNDRLPKFELDSDLPLQARPQESSNDSNHQNSPISQACLVHNSETIRIKYFLDILVDLKFPVMLIGAAGSGKTLIINEKLGQMDEDFLIANVPFNFYYNSELTQKILEKPLEKKARKHLSCNFCPKLMVHLMQAGKNYGPPGSKKLIYFLDDMNMPEVFLPNTISSSCFQWSSPSLHWPIIMQVDKYGTVGPHTIIRQHMDYGHWYVC